MLIYDIILIFLLFLIEFVDNSNSMFSLVQLTIVIFVIVH